MLFLSIHRKKIGISQDKLGCLIGVDKNTIWRWEMGKTAPRASDIKRLCEVLNVSEAELLNGPVKNELKINFIWEVEDMDVLNIASNEFNFGFRGNDVLLWGALPDDEDEENLARRLAREIKAARVGKAAMKTEREKG